MSKKKDKQEKLAVYLFKNLDFNGDISGWNVSKVIDMDYIFYLCPIEDKYKPKF